MPDSCNVCSFRFLALPYFHAAGNMFATRCEYVRNLVDPIYFEKKMYDAASSFSHTRSETLPYFLLGTGPFATSHWIYSHPDVTPCDLFPMVDPSSLAGAEWAMAMAPRFPFGAYRNALSPSDKLPKTPWLLFEGRKHEWVENYGRLPTKDSWVDGFFSHMGSDETSLCDTLWTGGKTKKQKASLF